MMVVMVWEETVRGKQEMEDKSARDGFVDGEKEKETRGREER